MGKVSLLDCTLRDGGYINDWNFGREAIHGILRGLAQTGIEMIEVGFIKGDGYDENRTLFPNITSFQNVLASKNAGIKYVGMLDMNAPVPVERLTPYDEKSIDGIRVIFKRNKIEEAYEYCYKIKELGYMLFVNFVSTDQYSDEDFIRGIKKFSSLQPDAITIVDTFGVLKKEDLLRYAMLADHNLDRKIMLAYHAHNNLQQAFGNAEALLELNLKRDVCIDATIFGMGRGAGNLNLELFAGYMNEQHNTQYQIAPMLEIMDEYLNDFYRTKFWGYSLPLYLSASLGCHPNYAIYLAEKNTLSVKAFDELMKQIPDEDKLVFSKETAEKYYCAYMEKYVDDKVCIQELAEQFSGKDVFVVAPGKSIATYMPEIAAVRKKQNMITVAVNFYEDRVSPDYVFFSNMRRFAKLGDKKNCKIIASSNISNAEKIDYRVNFSSYVAKHKDIIDNSGLMALRILAAAGVKHVFVAGMDGYSEDGVDNYLFPDVTPKKTDAVSRNRMISAELKEINKYMSIEMLTPTVYDFKENTK